MPLTIIRGDITKLSTDAVVNAANNELLMGGGVCGAIFHAAGAENLQAACDELAPIETGKAVITEGFKLPAKYIIHTAGPVFIDGSHGEASLLRSCYTSSLMLAIENNCESIAFPLISSGLFGYPKAEAFHTATMAISDFLREHDIAVSIVLYGGETPEINEELHESLEQYINERVDKKRNFENRKLLQLENDLLKDTLSDFHQIESKKIVSSDVFITEPEARNSLDNLVGNLDEPFSATLLRHIDASGKKDAEIYHRANIDRRLFSKIRSNEHYTPSKPTVIAFAVALELTLEQTSDLLERAGFALSHARKFDVIVEYFISSRQYDIFLINEVLFSYDQPLLGA